MKRKYIVVRAGSWCGYWIVERNDCAPKVNHWTLACVEGYASTLKGAEAIASKANAKDARDEEAAGR